MGLHITWQAPATQELTDPTPERHATPQVPQEEGLVVRSVSQPLEAAPSQLPHPAWQVKPQEPAEQVVAVACAGRVQGAGA
ncbi:MAG: hypothetical protein IPF99_29075 [Deltaproteobacteria bacterium]|nr:hypothetical protein [Deltaproteobacteria bacterium]